MNPTIKKAFPSWFKPRVEPYGVLERWVAAYQMGDRSVMENVLRGCGYMVLGRVNHWHKPGGRVDREDLFNEGLMGVMRAAELYKPDQGTCFLTYAKMWVDAMLARVVCHQWTLVKIGTSNSQRREFFQNENAGREMQQRKRGELSLSAVPRAPSEDPGTDYCGLLASSSPTPEEELGGLEASAVDRSTLLQAVAKLPPKWRRIIEGRYLTDPRMNLYQMGDELGVCRERVRQLEQQALSRLCRLLGAPEDPVALRLRLRKYFKEGREYLQRRPRPSEQPESVVA